MLRRVRFWPDLFSIVKVNKFFCPLTTSIGARDQLDALLFTQVENGMNVRLNVFSSGKAAVATTSGGATTSSVGSGWEFRFSVPMSDRE